MVFYFTATGNSLYIAKKLSQKPISIPQAMKGSSFHFVDETIGVVCPIFAGEPPKIVKDFLEKSTFETDYFYMLLTYGMSASDAPEFTAKLMKKQGLKIDYIGTVLMVDNYLPVFDMNEQMAMEKHVDLQIEEQLAAIQAHKCEIPKASLADRTLHATVAAQNKANPAFNNGEQITVTDACVGCGICTKVCPIGDFYLQNGTAKRKRPTCEFCLACAQNCPQKAIKLSIADRNPNARYRNPQITLEEIIQANDQT